ncbi:MAG: NAAT family transporter [Gammaproteobacteria bacterium]|nr:NAAT family transporter [Gammaproteobacteria bacterium]
MEYITEYTRFFTALIVIIDPFGAIPILLSLTRDYTIDERSRAITIAMVTVMIVLSLSAIFGETMLSVLGASLPSFRVGGGIVLLLMALAMLRAQPDKLRTTSAETIAADSRENIAIVPIAIPLLAGPGSISTVIIEMHRPGAEYHLIWVVAVIMLVGIILWGVLRLATPIGRILGPIGLNILNRLFGLILTAIAIEIMANGLRDLFPLLAG